MQIRPSEILQIEHSYDAWCIDEAIWLLGQKLKSGERLKVKKTDDNSKLLKELGLLK